MRLLGCAHGGLEQVLDGDLIPQGLVEQPLSRCQLAVGQDLNLHGRSKWVRNYCLFVGLDDL